MMRLHNLRLSSGETRKVNSSWSATIGISNSDQKNIKIGKAGRNRWRGKDLKQEELR